MEESRADRIINLEDGGVVVPLTELSGEKETGELLLVPLSSQKLQAVVQRGTGGLLRN